MDSASKKLFILLAVLTVIAIGATYYRAFVSGNFETVFDDYSSEAES